MHEARDVFLISDIAYIDLAKAFDKVSYSKLLHKLSYYGVSVNLYNTLKYYLLDRKQRVKVMIVSLTSHQLYMVFLNMTVICPLLLLIYINDFHIMK